MEFVVSNLTWYADVHNFLSSETFCEVIGICQCNDLNNLLCQNAEITLNENSNVRMIMIIKAGLCTSEVMLLDSEVKLLSLLKSLSYFKTF